MRQPLISIIVPVYNLEPYIAECVESILAQTYRNLQIILVDDGSEDCSGDICDAFAEKDGRIIVLHQDNGGAVSARKSGLKVADGEYIGFVDGDDYIETEMYERMLEELEESGADFVHIGYAVGTCEKIPFQRGVLNMPQDKTEILSQAVLADDAYILPGMCTKLFRAELIKKCFARVPDEVGYGEDLINLCVCMLESRSISLLDEAHYRYRVRDGSMSHHKKMDSLTEEIVLYQSICDVLRTYGCYAQMKEEMDRFLYSHILISLKKISTDGFQVAQYYYPDMDGLRGKKIVLYGAGGVGRDYYAQLSRFADCEIVAWVDRNPDGCRNIYRKVEKPEVMADLDYDFVILALNHKEVAHMACQQLVEAGVLADRIKWEMPHNFFGM